MTKTINDGGPAFPRPMSVGPDGLWQLANDGMSQRDWHAGLAMQGFVSNHENIRAMRAAAEQEGITIQAMVARTAYEMADAMLAERGRAE